MFWASAAEKPAAALRSGGLMPVISYGIENAHPVASRFVVGFVRARNGEPAAFRVDLMASRASCADVMSVKSKELSDPNTELNAPSLNSTS